MLFQENRQESHRPRRTPPSSASVAQIFFAIAALWLLFLSTGCGLLSPRVSQDARPIPATLEEVRAAIDSQRAQLKLLVVEPRTQEENQQQDTARTSDEANNELVAIARHLAQLQVALHQLEERLEERLEEQSEDQPETSASNETQPQSVPAD